MSNSANKTLIINIHLIFNQNSRNQVLSRTDRMSKVQLQGGTELYMSPEFRELWNKNSDEPLKGEKNDVFSLGMTLLQDYLTLENKELKGINKQGGEYKISALLTRIYDKDIKQILAKMLNHNPYMRIDYYEVIEYCYYL